MSRPPQDRSRPDDAVADWVLLRFRVGELPLERMETIRQQVAEDPALAARLAAMDEQEAALHRRLPPRVLAASVAERAPRRSAWRWGVVPALAAAVIVAVVLPRTGPGDTRQPGVEQAATVRAKGAEPYLRIFRQVHGGTEELRRGDAIAEGDVLQLHYAALGREWGAVFSVDGDGVITLHLPPDGGSAAHLEPEGTVVLPRSYVLDDAPDYERFFLVTGDAPFPLGPVLASLDVSATAPDLPPSLDLDVFELRKAPVRP